MAIEIVDFPIKNGDFPVRKLLVYQRVDSNLPISMGFERVKRMISKPWNWLSFGPHSWEHLVPVLQVGKSLF